LLVVRRCCFCCWPHDLWRWRQFFWLPTLCPCPLNIYKIFFSATAAPWAVCQEIRIWRVGEGPGKIPSEGCRNFPQTVRFSLNSFDFPPLSWSLATLRFVIRATVRLSTGSCGCWLLYYYGHCRCNVLFIDCAHSPQFIFSALQAPFSSVSFAFVIIQQKRGEKSEHSL